MIGMDLLTNQTHPMPWFCDSKTLDHRSRDCIDQIICLPDGKRFIAVLGASVYVWKQTPTREWLREAGSPILHTAVVRIICLSSNLFVSGDFYGWIRTWRLQQNTQKWVVSQPWQLPGSNALLEMIRLPNDDIMCFAGDEKLCAIRVEPEPGSVRLVYAAKIRASVEEAVCMPNGDVIGKSDDEIWNCWKVECPNGFGPVVQCSNGPTTTVTMISDDRIVLLSMQGILHIWEEGYLCGWNRGPEIDHEDRMQSMAKSFDGHIVTITRKGKICLWQIQPRGHDWKCETEFQGHDEFATCVACCPDGRILSSAVDKQIRTWVNSQTFRPFVAIFVLCSIKNFI